MYATTSLTFTKTPCNTYCMSTITCDALETALTANPNIEVTRLEEPLRLNVSLNRGGNGVEVIIEFDDDDVTIIEAYANCFDASDPDNCYKYNGEHDIEIEDIESAILVASVLESFKSTKVL